MMRNVGTATVRRSSETGCTEGLVHSEVGGITMSNQDLIVKEMTQSAAHASQ
jgi:hypothetical protein